MRGDISSIQEFWLWQS